MKKLMLLLSMTVCFATAYLNADNPLIMDQFTADPTARVFDGRVYVYPSHDIPASPGKGRADWFVMEDYHVFSSDGLINWKDHGVIVQQDKVAWANPKGYAMWAPDCISKNGKYYFYFPAPAKKQTTAIGGMAIGVAVSKTPYGPFVPEKEPIKGVAGIDPNLFIDKDGQAYIYWAGKELMGAKLKDNMLELASEPTAMETLPKGMKEGPFLFERNGIYYFTFPHVIKKTEALVYAMGKSPLGPFEYKGIIMDEHPSQCWTNHHSFIEYKGQWYLFYHHNDLSPKFDKNRAIRADKLYFNNDGTIKKVIPTLRGVGIRQANEMIQIDRYSGISGEGASITFLDEKNTFAGWKTVFTQKNALIKYDDVDFGNKNYKSVKLRVLAETGGSIELQIGKKSVNVEIPKTSEWKVISTDVKEKFSGIQNITVTSKTTGNIEIDWVQFK